MKLQDICRQISTSASHLAAPEANSPDCSSNFRGSFRINIEPASSSSSSQSSPDLVTTQSSQFLHPLACPLDANYSSNAFSPNTEYK
ncbi:hypothetical transcript [Echinococcus multilocularis]|uniref:Hypothetical transcript n=1 Tax=Echinococcus multilocularis TaxID=6211 RepID=A0A068XUY1_ECHMU|nr:hypothetical transcript [Echinococcus multilocularis]